MLIQDNSQAINGRQTAKSAAKSSTAIPRLDHDPGAAEWYSKLAALQARPSAIINPSAASVVVARKLPAKKHAAVAVRYIRGEVSIKSTVADAATIFAVSPSYITKAKRGAFDLPKLKLHDRLKCLAAKASFEQVVDLITSDPKRFWEAFEVATSASVRPLTATARATTRVRAPRRLSNPIDDHRAARIGLAHKLTVQHFAI